MADNINYNEKKKSYSFVTAKEPPWHARGKIVDNVMTSSEAIELANLDYIVDKARLAAIFPDGLDKKSIYLNNNFVTYRQDTLDTFGIVSDSYAVVQNKDAFAFMDSIVGESRAIYETAGALGNGSTIFITAKLPYYIKIKGNDVIENYLVVSNGHDGKTSLNIFLTPIRVVCQNTLAFATSSAKMMIKLRHTTNIHDKLEDAMELLHITKTITEENQLIFSELANRKISDEKVANYINNVFLTNDEITILNDKEINIKHADFISTRKKNIIYDVNKFYQIGVGQKEIIGSVFGAYNAVTGYLSNVKKYGNDDKKMSNLVLGGSDFNLSSKALSYALELEN